MPASMRMPGSPGRTLQLFFIGIVALAGGGAASGKHADAAATLVAPAAPIATAQVELIGRATVPATVGGRPTGALAFHTLADQGWPVAIVDTLKGIVGSQWMYFRQGASIQATRPGAPPLSAALCWIRVRLVAQPAGAGRDSLVLGAQARFTERVGTGAASAYARSLFDAFQKDVLAGGPQGGHGNLKPLLNFAPEGDFLVCGAHTNPVDRQ